MDIEKDGPEIVARRFHQLYEGLAPQYGYTTRPETRVFDPTSANGRLMVEVCRQLLADPDVAVAVAESLAEKGTSCVWTRTIGWSLHTGWRHRTQCGQYKERGEGQLPRFCENCGKTIELVVPGKIESTEGAVKTKVAEAVAVVETQPRWCAEHGCRENIQTKRYILAHPDVTEIHAAWLCGKHAPTWVSSGYREG